MYTPCPYNPVTTGLGLYLEQFECFLLIIATNIIFKFIPTLATRLSINLVDTWTISGRNNVKNKKNNWEIHPQLFPTVNGNNATFLIPIKYLSHFDGGLFRE